MAREYDVTCLSCGYKWLWCKYDAPDDKCPHCGKRTTRKVPRAEWNESPIWVDGFQYDRWWDKTRVAVVGP